MKPQRFGKKKRKVISGVNLILGIDFFNNKRSFSSMNFRVHKAILTSNIFRLAFIRSSSYELMITLWCFVRLLLPFP